MNMRKKICFVVSDPSTAVVFLKKHIVELGRQYDIYLVANISDEQRKLFSDIKLIAIRHVSIDRKISIFADLKALWQLRTYFLRKHFDVVHSVTPKAGLLSMLAARLAGIKNRIHIFTGQVWHTKTGLFKYLLMSLDKIIAANATNVLVDGNSQRDFLIKNKIITYENSAVLGKGSISGVDTAKFVFDLSVREAVRGELGIMEGEIVIMFLGRMNRDKGIVELFEAFHLLSCSYVNIKLLLVGPDEENMAALAKERISHIERVIFYGATTTPARLLQACDIFCLPSHREGFGTSIIEASLLEKPIVCSDTYGLLDTIRDEQTGLRHKVGDVFSLSAALEKLITDPEKRKILGETGRKYVLGNYSAEEISSKWVGFYNNLLQ